MMNDEMRDMLNKTQERLRQLLREYVVYTGQEGDNDGLPPGAFCRYCSEEIPLDGLLDSQVVWNHHLKNCRVFSLRQWIRDIDKALG